jgi:hypothetical protein
VDNTFLSSYGSLSQEVDQNHVERVKREYNWSRTLSLAVKRFADIVFALVAMAVFFIPCVIIAIAIWLEDRHNPIFRQERIGYRGRPFMLYKFRSMRTDAEKDNHPELCQDKDDRCTRIGAFIRSHHLDEFPQLWNVLKGEMSFVGYRPERRFFIDQIMEHNADYERLYALRPGLFSEATLYNGYTDTIEKMLTRLDMDLDYLNNRSLMLDMKIITKTALSIICGKKF